MMKIDFPSGMGVFRKNVNTSANSAPVKSSSAEGKTDVIDFSHGRTTGVDKDLLTLKSKVQRDVSFPTDPVRLEELREKVKSGTYCVSTDQIVGAILGD